MGKMILFRNMILFLKETSRPTSDGSSPKYSAACDGELLLNIFYHRGERLQLGIVA